MKQRQNILSQGEPVVLMAVPSEMLEQIIQKLDELSAVVKGGHPEKLGDWISEKEAQKLLGRKATWFWNRRKNGELVFTKVGNKIMYSRESILAFLNQHTREEVRYDA
jgi:hypothetical protein